MVERMDSAAHRSSVLGLQCSVFSALRANGVGASHCKVGGKGSKSSILKSQKHAQGLRHESAQGCQGRKELGDFMNQSFSCTAAQSAVKDSTRGMVLHQPKTSSLLERFPPSAPQRHPHPHASPTPFTPQSSHPAHGTFPTPITPITFPHTRCPPIPPPLRPLVAPLTSAHCRTREWRTVIAAITFPAVPFTVHSALVAHGEDPDGRSGPREENERVRHSVRKEDGATSFRWDFKTSTQQFHGATSTCSFTNRAAQGSMAS